ncbi:hypothetical protein EMIT0111MI5_10315 [Burkholderia sp. IT-111MI5]
MLSTNDFADSIPLIRIVPAELEIGGQLAPETPQPLQQFIGPRLAADGKHARAIDHDLDVVPFAELQGFDHSGGKADGQAIAPLCDLHTYLLGYTLTIVYLPYLACKDGAQRMHIGSCRQSNRAIIAHSRAITAHDGTASRR